MVDIPAIVLEAIKDSDALEEKLNDISIDLVANIQDELVSGHGYIRGDLQDSINSDVAQEGLNGIVRAYSQLEYAKWVNEGHSQEPGRFIPGEWNGNKFDYKPGAKTGMVLKASFVEGLHFMEAGLEKTVAMYK